MFSRSSWQTIFNHGYFARCFHHLYFVEIFVESYKTYIEKAQIENRTFYPLENAFLPEETPLDRKELWFDGKINDSIEP